MDVFKDCVVLEMEAIHNKTVETEGRIIHFWNQKINHRLAFVGSFELLEDILVEVQIHVFEVQIIIRSDHSSQRCLWVLFLSINLVYLFLSQSIINQEEFFHVAFEELMFYPFISLFFQGNSIETDEILRNLFKNGLKIWEFNGFLIYL